MDQINLTLWEGRTSNEHGGVSPETALMWYATLGDAQVNSLVAGDPLPPLTHWCAFPPTARTNALQNDGHPRIGDFLPPVALSRRMWAGGNLALEKPIHVGEPLEKVSKIRSVVTKDGHSGPMVFVTVDHEIFGNEGRAISEQQDIVYMEVPDSF